MLRYFCILPFAFLAPLWAQSIDIGEPHGNVFTRPYRTRTVPTVSMADSERLEKLTRAGKIYLSLRDAIALALENNLDIEYARWNPRLSEANELRASAGQLLRNVSNNINQGPSSASIGVLSGANALGTTGAAASTGGQGGVLSGLNVQLAGSAIPNLDPVAFGFWQYSHTTLPQTSTFVTGTNFLVTDFQSGNYGIQKGFLTGTTATLGMVNTFGLSQNAPQNDFNPSTSANITLQVTQNLLQGFGRAVNNRAIRVAKNQRHISDLTFKAQVIATVRNVVDLYWDLVSFNDQLKARQKAYELNRTLYDDNRRRAELGALAEIDIVQTEAEMKSAQQDVITADAQVQQQEMILKSVLTRSGLDNLALATARIVPTDSYQVPATEPVVPIQDLVAEAFTNRPEIAQNDINLENARINMLGTKNALLPTLQAFANVQNNGQAGAVNTIPVPTTINGETVYAVRTPADVNGYFLGGYGTVLGQVFRRNFPNYTVGMQLSIPLRNRAAQADLITDELNYRQSQIQDKQQRNNIKLSVINSDVALKQARAAYDTSLQARSLQEQTLAGERRKYDLGASTILNVIIVQRDTTTRELAEIQALNQYVHAKTGHEYNLGRVLTDYDVSLDQALSGVVKQEPALPPVIDQGGRGGSR